MIIFCFARKNWSYTSKWLVCRVLAKALPVMAYRPHSMAKSDLLLPGCGFVCLLFFCLTRSMIHICKPRLCWIRALIITPKNLTKSYYKNYLQNTPHMVLHNCPTLSIATERLTCLNNSRGVQLGTLVQHAVGPRFEPRVLRALFSPPFLPSSFEKNKFKCFD